MRGIVMLLRTISILILGLSLLLIGCNDATNSDLSNEELSRLNETNQGNGLDYTAKKNSNSSTILEIAADNEDFSVLAQAVLFADLDKALDGKRQLTVFAPTNDAFEVLLSNLGLTAEELLVEENKNLVKNILLYHVAPGNRPAEDVIDSDKIRTLSKKFVEVEVDDGSVQVGNDENGFVNVIATDIMASNGVIHVIDGVMLPPTNKSDEDGDNGDEWNDDDEMENNNATDSILDIAGSNNDFSILAQAVIFAGLDEALDGRRQFTVFAPNNSAFEALLSELGLTAEELLVEENKNLVKNILLYHVAPGNRPAEDVIDSDKIRTLSKKFVEVEVDDGSVQVGNKENGFVNIIATDIMASNGVIHVIDGVMLPPASKDDYDDDDDGSEDDD